MMPKTESIITSAIIIFFIVLPCCAFEAAKQVSNTSIQNRNQKDIEKSKAPNEVGEKELMALLQAFEKHTEIDKNFIYKAAWNSNLSITKDLARQLLKDWNLAANSASLNNPFILKIGSYEPAQHPRGCSIDISIEIEVTEIGTVETWKSSIAQQRLLHCNFINVEESVFRPAFVNGKFKPGKATILLHPPSPNDK